MKINRRKMKMIKHKNIFARKTVEIYGSADLILLEELKKSTVKDVKIFLDKSSKIQNPEVGGVLQLASLESLSSIGDSMADMCLLDGRAVKVLFARLPTDPKYILVRLRFSPSWMLGFLGLIRRLVIGRVWLEGITLIPEESGRKGRWLVLRNLRGGTEEETTLSLDVGIQNFLNYLRKENVDYVVMRFYEKLPSLYREGGDLDILVADKDKEKVYSFLRQNPGSIIVGVQTVYGPTSWGGVTYYPPFLARKILDSAKEGPARSRIPALKETFLSLAYHCLYHKGYKSGIPNAFSNVWINSHYAENDYLGILQTMAKKLGVQVGGTMEEIDEYLEKEGWRPKLDMLSKIAPYNEWVRKRFFSYHQVKKMKDFSLSVFILKERAFQLEVEQEILKGIKEKGLHIIEKNRLSKEERKFAMNHLRGGNWVSEHGNAFDFYPAMAVVALDIHSAYAANLHIIEYKSNRVKKIKKKLRRRFDTEKTSLIHSTDNTHEAWQYIEVCFPGRVDEIRQKVESRYAALAAQSSLIRRLRSYMILTPHIIRSRTIQLRNRIIQYLIK